MEGNLCIIVSKIYVAITRTCQGAATKIKINVRTYPFEKINRIKIHVHKLPINKKHTPTPQKKYHTHHCNWMTGLINHTKKNHLVH